MAAHSDLVNAGGAMPPVATLEPGREGARMVPVWDPFVRIFHWSLVTLFVVAFVTGDEIERVHVAAGYAIAGLVVLRIMWGVIGPRHARFSDFLRPPRDTVSYMRRALSRQAPRYVGHNPAGGLMTIALLAMLIAISATGYMMTTDAYWGAEWVEELHEGLVYGTLALIVLHVIGVLVTSYEHGENLVKAMVTGRKRA